MRLDSEPGSAITPTGAVNLCTVTSLRRELRDAERAGVDPVQVDLRMVTHLDATGLGVLTGAAMRLQTQGRSLLVTHPSSKIRRLMALTGTTQLLSHQRPTPRRANPSST